MGMNLSSFINNMPIKERNDGRLEGRLTVNCKRKSFYGDSKAEVRRKAKAYLMQIENGYMEPKKISLDQYVEYWLQTYKWNKIEMSSYTRLYRVFQCQVKGKLGSKMIGDICRADIQELIDMHANPHDDSIVPLALSGLKRLMELLRPCFAMAVKEEIIGKNPCDGVCLPVESCIQKKTRKQFSLSDEELKKFKVAALEKYASTGEFRSRDALVLLIILGLGLRVGEALALEWEDVDTEKGVVYINKTVQSNIKNFDENALKKQFNRVKNSTKTSSGVRVLKLNASLLSYFDELKAYDSRNKIDSSHVVCTKNGTRNNSANLQRSLNRLIKRSTINQHMTLHTLRHTFGSTLIRRGVGVEVVSKLMGHANINITYKNYTHVLQEQQVMAMQSIDIC